MYTRCDNAAFANFVAAISRTNSNWFEFVRLIAATKFCRSDNDFHEINRVTQGDLLRRLVPATCRSNLSPSVSRPLRCRQNLKFGDFTSSLCSPLRYLLNACCTCSTIIYALLTNNIIVLWRCRSRSRRRFLKGILSKDDGYGYGNATKKEYDWLKKEKYSCCTCSTNFRAFLCRTPKNINVKSPNFRFWRQREHITMKRSFFVLTLKPFVSIQLQDSSPVLYKANKTEYCDILAIAISFILD